ncbi:hypothetical protein RN001_015132 [Aquatica leii]|uniref:Uncharacterized protein n=1 Tax=Aquatica leii TaxID=1421715 RepID=A0AAN7SKZ4_9COLE|nr:hypothetical protein RN001_015132 [Aquatica leii]
MGTATSRTRRLTVENEEKACVIKVSDEVVKRLKQCEEEVRQQTQLQPVVPFPALPEGQVPVYIYDPRLTTTLQSQQEKIQALKRNDEYWERRITDLENWHKEMHKTMEGEYNKAVKELGIEKKYECDTPPCQISKKKVIECYKEYPKQPMRCLKEVQAFTDCVDLQRAILIDSKARS